mmetsp:Transcript_2796/g.5174  ORF Transcript_2796/g.5174 Transcript_2796/m.5174 type:complete len:248 (+) Transcript_2796:201-944(+)
MLEDLLLDLRGVLPPRTRMRRILDGMMMRTTGSNMRTMVMTTKMHSKKPTPSLPLPWVQLLSWVWVLPPSLSSPSPATSRPMTTVSTTRKSSNRRQRHGALTRRIRTCDNWPSAPKWSMLPMLALPLLPMTAKVMVMALSIVLMVRIVRLELPWVWLPLLRAPLLLAWLLPHRVLQWQGTTTMPLPPWNKTRRPPHLSPLINKVTTRHSKNPPPEIFRGMIQECPPHCNRHTMPITTASALRKSGNF